MLALPGGGDGRGPVRSGWHWRHAAAAAAAADKAEEPNCTHGRWPLAPIAAKGANLESESKEYVSTGIVSMYCIGG
eukprot:COSAG06_NODE_584_length_14005_cov_23.423486_10_plen_76_part_00